MKRNVALIGLALIVLLLSGCVPGPNALANSAAEGGEVAGFWLGLWHGIIAPVTFIGSLFSKTWHMYEVHNNGAWYNGGFLLGMMIIFGSGGSAGKRARS